MEAISRSELKRVIEAILFNNSEPMSIAQLQSVVFADLDVKKVDIEDAINKLQQEYRLKSIELVELANGFTFRTKARFAPWLAKCWQEKPARYSRAMLETLALIAYQQPITRGQIEEIRGVAVSSHIIKTLTERGWVKIVGHKEVPGRPALYGTEKAFLDYFGLKSLAELPQLSEPESIDILSKRLAQEFDESVAKPQLEKLN